MVAGAGAAAAVLALVADPTGAAEAAARTATGLASVDGARVTAWPLVALVPCLAVAATGVLALLAGRGWRTSGRFEAPAPSAPPSAPSAPAAPPSRSRLWDDLSEGHDPTLPERRDAAG